MIGFEHIYISYCRIRLNTIAIHILYTTGEKIPMQMNKCRENVIVYYIDYLYVICVYYINMIFFF